jgi:large subunit ribosomal protein L5
MSNRFYNYCNFSGRLNLIYESNLHSEETNILDSIKIHKFEKDLISNPELISTVILSLELISGRKPKLIRAKKSIAAFRYRKGMLVGCKVTLRKKDMYSFLDRFTNEILPKQKDFTGINGKHIKQNFTFSIGIQNIFFYEELSQQYDRFKKLGGFDINIIFKNSNIKNLNLALSNINFPIR